VTAYQKEKWLNLTGALQRNNSFLMVEAIRDDDVFAQSFLKSIREVTDRWQKRIASERIDGFPAGEPVGVTVLATGRPTQGKETNDPRWNSNEGVEGSRVSS
jgi:hypothetical protein